LSIHCCASTTSRTTATTGWFTLSPAGRAVYRPAPHCRTRILSYSLRVLPAKHFINWQQDPQANYLARLTFPDKTSELRIEVDLVAEMAVFNPLISFSKPYAQQFSIQLRGRRGTRAGPVPEPTCGNTTAFELPSSRFPVRKSSRSIFSSS